jgi:hypothetical protein
MPKPGDGTKAEGDGLLTRITAKATPSAIGVSFCGRINGRI